MNGLKANPTVYQRSRIPKWHEERKPPIPRSKAARTNPGFEIKNPRNQKD